MTRSLVLTVGEILKELYQERRRRLRDVRPRLKRSWDYVLLRGATNVLLRHVNLAVVAEQMMRGAPSVYCDFVDYDEIAHHAGPTRPEALAALEGVDGVLAALEEVGAAAPRPYRLVVLSDHGQSQGATFAQRYGVGLEELIRRWTVRDTVLVNGGEAEGRAGLLRAGLRAPAPPADAPDPAARRPEVIVAASGNLALVYLARLPGRVTREELDAHYPELLPGLLGHPGVGWVMVRSHLLGAVVLGAAGHRRLRDDHVDGVDPLAGYGPHAADDLRRHDGLADVGDLLVNSRWNSVTQEVAAFEELIGCHGGLGGWQNRAVLIHPGAWAAPEELIGADAVHRLLCGRLEQVGCRSIANLSSPVRDESVPASLGDAETPGRVTERRTL